MTQTHLVTRIEDLLAGMTLEEKIGQLTMVRGGSGAGGPELSDAQLDDVRAGRVGSILDVWAQPGIRRAQEVAVKESRLGIPLLVTLDVLHGYETIFPIPLGEAAAFDPALWEATARAAAQEASAAWIDLTFAPMLDVSRDARWGRIAESPGEDPWVVSRFAEAKVRGFQQETLSRPGAVAATAKHLGGYGAVMSGREYNSVDISARSLHEVHLPPFVAAVRAGAAAIMPSFNDLAGVPMTGHSAILRGLVRERWGFDGVMISDFSAVAELVPHGVAADLAEAAALALKAGVDIDMVSDAYSKGLPVALARGLVEEALLDEAVRRVLTLKGRLGLLDDPLRERTSEQLQPRQARRDLARDAARRSIVLLQNRGELLPLRGADAKNLAVLGPLAESPKDMLGPWYAAGKASQARDFLGGIREALPGWQIAYAAGTGIHDEDPASFSTALEAAGKADIVLLCVGEAAGMCGEAASRAHPGLPPAQRRFVEAVFELGKPVIVALSCGRPITAAWLFEKADAVLVTWFLGSEAGPALADVLTGECNPSGKLPVSWARDVGQMPIFYAQRPTGRPIDADPNNAYTSRYVDMPNEPQFPFGHGLSYTRFAYGAMRLSSTTMAPGETVSVEVDIVNEGTADGEETAFLFIRDPVASVARPVLELKGFARVLLPAGASGTVRFELCGEEVAFMDEEGNAVLESGRRKADHRFRPA